MGHACSKKSTAEVKSTAPAQAGGAPAGDGKLKVALIYYTMYGHVKTLADQVKAGLEQGGAEVTMYQVPEILPEEVLKKMGAPPKPADTGGLGRRGRVAGADGERDAGPGEPGAADPLESAPDYAGALRVLPHGGAGPGGPVVGVGVE
mmetsp:Transcript_43260/g.113965  ORF Transcript_43260/g.113965 Transcript_43260/m.113965 type:complete len:148 (+) Transcript_43260:35-478(+)